MMPTVTPSSRRPRPLPPAALGLLAALAVPACYGDVPSTPPDAAARCRLSSDCAPGLACVAGACTVECREDRDCIATRRGARCDTAIGRCVAAATDGGADGAALDATAPGADVVTPPPDAAPVAEDAPGVADAPPADVPPAPDAAPTCPGPACDENTPAASGCDECGGGGGWGAALFAYRGVCAYSNGVTTGVEPCRSPAIARTTDGQTPLGCSDGTVRTYLGDERRASYAFQCVEYARRVSTSRLPSWASIAGNACSWWASAASARGVRRYDNGGVEAPRPDDLLVFNSPGDRCTADHVGHIGVVSRVDAGRGEVVLVDQNRAARPAVLSYAVAGGRHRVGTFGAYVLKGWVRVGDPDLSCGVRSALHASASAGSASDAQLVGCPAGYTCDVDARTCAPVGSCGSGEACRAGTRCVAGVCVCDASAPVTATSFTFDGDARCFSAGPFVRGAEGCSLSLGVARDPTGTRALYLRDLAGDDPQLLSPRLDWNLSPDQTIDVELVCRGLSGPSVTEARVYLAPPADEPTFAEGPLSIGRVRVTCDGTVQRLRFPLSGVPAGMRRVGWARFDVLDGERRYAGAEVWVRSISVQGSGSVDCGMLANCGGRCVDTTTDGANCGACGNACASPLRCSGSRCALVCPAGESPCGASTCANLDTNPSHCGACNRACPAGQSCVSGVCRCPAGQQACGGTCVDTNSSVTHCGGCDLPCPAGQSCVSGACRCPSGQQRCGGSCVDIGSNSSHCGGCNLTCAADQSCVSGACRCAGSLVQCGGSCVDTSTSASHCGGCGRPCGAGSTCRAGACTTTCGGAGQACCAGSCGGGLYCIGGLCQEDATPGMPVYRFADVCSSAHWHSTTSCYPSTSSATVGCNCPSRVTNGTCATPTCWRRENSFNTASRDPGYGRFFPVNHCFVSGGNRYSRAPCAAGTVGDPPTLGWAAESAVGPYTRAVFLCEWMAGTVREQFLTTSDAECRSVGTIVGGAAFGYVN